MQCSEFFFKTSKNSKKLLFTFFLKNTQYQIVPHGKLWRFEQGAATFTIIKELVNFCISGHINNEVIKSS